MYDKNSALLRTGKPLHVLTMDHAKKDTSVVAKEGIPAQKKIQTITNLNQPVTMRQTIVIAVIVVAAFAFSVNQNWIKL